MAGQEEDEETERQLQEVRVRAWVGRVGRELGA